MWHNLEGAANQNTIATMCTCILPEQGGTINKPSRWKNIVATYLTGSRQKCSTCIRGAPMQTDVWLVYTLGKSSQRNKGWNKALMSQCMLCNTGKVETQTHTSTTAHEELSQKRGIYKKKINTILQAFIHIKQPKCNESIWEIMKFITGEKQRSQQTYGTADGPDIYGRKHLSILKKT